MNRRRSRIAGCVIPQRSRFPLRFYASVACVLWLTANVACAPRKRIAPVASARSTISRDSYMDLAPGHRIRIVVPLPGVVRAVEAAPAQGDGRTVILDSKEGFGYQVAHYLVVGSRDGQVRLKFVSKETIVDGIMTRETRAPSLPFRLPKGTNLVRLVYLTRLSSADHNMAILAAKHTDVLDEFTDQFNRNPSVCGQRSDVLCSWVPLGFAVRPER